MPLKVSAKRVLSEVHKIPVGKKVVNFASFRPVGRRKRFLAFSVDFLKSNRKEIRLFQSSFLKNKNDLLKGKTVHENGLTIRRQFTGDWRGQTRSLLLKVDNKNKSFFVKVGGHSSKAVFDGALASVLAVKNILHGKVGRLKIKVLLPHIVSSLGNQRVLVYDFIEKGNIVSLDHLVDSENLRVSNRFTRVHQKISKVLSEKGVSDVAQVNMFLDTSSNTIFVFDVLKF